VATLKRDYDDKTKNPAKKNCEKCGDSHEVCCKCAEVCCSSCMAELRCYGCRGIFCDNCWVDFGVWFVSSSFCALFDENLNVRCDHCSCKHFDSTVTAIYCKNCISECVGCRLKCCKKFCMPLKQALCHVCAAPFCLSCVLGRDFDGKVCCCVESCSTFACGKCWFKKAPLASSSSFSLTEAVMPLSRCQHMLGPVGSLSRRQCDSYSCFRHVAKKVWPLFFLIDVYEIGECYSML